MNRGAGPALKGNYALPGNADWATARREQRQAPPLGPRAMWGGENPVRRSIAFGIVPAVHICLRVPASNERGPQYMDLALAAIHQANHARLPIALEFRRHEGQVTLACHAPDSLRTAVTGQMSAQYPDCQITPLGGEKQGDAHKTWERGMALRHHLFPIRRYVQFEDALNRVVADPLAALLTTLAQDPRCPSLDCSISICVRPVPRAARRRAVRSLRRLVGPFFRRHHLLAHWYADLANSPNVILRVVGFCLGRLEREPHDRFEKITTSAGRQHEREEDLQAAGDKLGRQLFHAEIRLRVTGPVEEEQRALSKIHEMAGAFGQFSSPRLASFHLTRGRRPRRFLLSTEELATLWHPATSTVRAETMTAVDSRALEPPVELPGPAQDPALAILGMTAFRTRRERFGILPADRRRHVAIVGKTGMGKTTLLYNLLGSDIRAGRGVALLDPHGDLCESVLAAVPKARTNEVILFDAADTGHPLSFNILHCPRPEQRPLVASGIVSAFKKLYGEFWGPRMEHIFRNALLALLETPGSSLLTVLRFLTDVRFRQPIVAKLQDPVVRGFWQQEFASLPVKFQLEAVAPIQNKLGAFISSPLLRNILGQTRNTLDLRTVLDEGRVLLVNLSKGRLGDDVSALLGSFLVTAIQLAAMSRADVPETERRDFYLYVDEFQNFATESFATVLSEARKYRLALTLANQYLGQLDEQTAQALFGNVGTLVSFQVGAADAEPLATEFGGDLTAPDLLRLPKYQAYVRLLIDGSPSRPFSMKTLPPGRAHDPDRPEIIRRFTHQRYCRPVAQVEKEIAATLAP